MVERRKKSELIYSFSGLFILSAKVSEVLYCFSPLLNQDLTGGKLLVQPGGFCASGCVA